MERVLASGPDLAEGPASMLALAPTQPSPNPASTAVSFRRNGLLKRPEDAFPLSYYLAVTGAYYLVVVSVLAAAGQSSWRLAALTVVGVVQELNFAACRRRELRPCVNADQDGFVPFNVPRMGTVFLTTGIAATVTGGVHSPLLVTFVGVYVTAVAAVGDRRQTRVLLGATALVVVLLALAPRSLTGPELSTAVQGVLTAAAVLVVGGLLAPVHRETLRKREELACARKEMAADALARAQSLEQIGSKVAHELKNPLTGVKALVQLGLRSPAEAPSHERLEVVEREVTRMQEILQNYLSFTRPLQAVSPKRIELGPLVSDTLIVLSARADDARVRLYRQGDATLEADPRRLKEALLNLVANAIEATPPGGEVVVEIWPAGDDAVIVVRDTGRGMAAETLRRIGTPFFTTREEGTGLGVVLARSVIAQHGGSLRYESEQGKGTRVRITLPRAASGARDAACAARR